MERLVKSRTPVRSRFTKTITNITTLLAAEPKDVDALQVEFGLLRALNEDLTKHDENVKTQLLDDNATEEVIEQEYERIEDYQRRFLLIQQQMKSSLNKKASSANVDSDPDDDFSSARSSVSIKKKSYKLPKVQLKTFKGDLKDWLGFWSQFKKIHEDEDLHDVDKFQYLYQAMEDGTEAKQIVESYPQTEENYPKAVEALKERFGREDLLLQVYIRELLKLVVTKVTQKEEMSLATLYIRLESHLRSLQSLKLENADPATWIFPLVESSLSEETLRAWQRSPYSRRDGSTENPKRNKLDILMEFIKFEVQNEQQILLAKSGFQTQTSHKKKEIKSLRNEIDEDECAVVPCTASGLFNAQSSGCIFCGRTHESKDCGKAIDLSMDERMEKIRRKKACFICLKEGHVSRKCKSFVKCLVCKEKHVTLMCPELKENQAMPKQNEQMENPQIDKSNTTTTQANIALCGDILLKTVMVRMYSIDMKKSTTVRVLFDDGSQRSYMTTTAAMKIESRSSKSELSRNVLFDGTVTEFEKTNIHNVILANLNGTYKMDVILREKSVLGGDVPRISNDALIYQLQRKGIQINDQSNSCDMSTTIDVVIGSDFWGRTMTGRMQKLEGGLLAVETVFGWTLCGPTQRESDNVGLNALSLFIGEQDLSRLWNLEVIGITENVKTQAEEDKADEAKRFFHQTVLRELDGRYSVKLPWTNDRISQNLPSNKKAALQRLKSTTKRLKAMDRFEAYDLVFRQWIEEGLVEVVQDSEQGHFLPHHPVFKNSLTTPVRPVFDASFKVGRAPSLNESLYKGPNCIELLPSAVLRFRERNLGVVADIRKAFQMISVQKDDRKYLKFLWWEDKFKKNMISLQHKRVVFGVNCSPFLLAAVLELHLTINCVEDQTIASHLHKSLYVDNVVTSVNSITEYDTFKKTSVRLLNDAGMELREWECTGDKAHSTNDTCVLGLRWQKQEDTLSIDMKKFKIEDNLTLRIILSIVHRIFDPIGFTAPVLICPKLIIQQGWRLKLGWDSTLPIDLQKDFKCWFKTCSCIEDIKIPRQVKVGEDVELHAFCDASMHAYSAAIYLRSGYKEERTIQLVMAKSRVTPTERMTIPRLELLACGIGARLMQHVKEAMNLRGVQTYCWSDSSTALSWIWRNDEWGTFVGNRVKRILEVTKAEDWRHIPGKYNPADLPSRGCDGAQLMASKWWEGPEWLRKENGEWPSEEFEILEHEISTEKRKTNISALAIQHVKWYAPKYSFSTTVRVFAWIRRFMSNCKRARDQREFRPFITIVEMRNAEKDVVKLIQEDAFHNCMSFDFKVVKWQDGLLRVRTSVVNRDDLEEFKWPVLLPRNNELVESLILEAHKTYNHGGVQFMMGILREKFWIVQTRRTISKALRKCLICRRFDAKPVEVVPAALPEKRVSSGEVFDTTGVDLAGPLFLRDGSKVWIILFTCAVYRCVYLDLVSSIDTLSFVQALERFIYQCGRPNTIYSDNGTNFVGANNLFTRIDWKSVEEISYAKKIVWIFNPPTAAWWGGWWERLIKSVKDLLRRMLGKAKLSYEELRNCLAAVSWTINERPLTTVSEDCQDLIPLTPARFLRGTKGAEFPEAVEISSLDLRRMNRKLANLQTALQARFRKEYLAMLVNRRKMKGSNNLGLGSVVLVGDHNKKRFEWLLGKIENLVPGTDGEIRVAEVKTKHGRLTRPLQNLYPLEMSDSEDVHTHLKNMNSKEGNLQQYPGEIVITTKSGRVIRKPNRYGAWNE